MDIDRLKRLAAHLRRALEYGDLRVTHGQALDLIAALPGLRNWPEVVAFPDRVGTARLDLPAVERILRAASRYGTPQMTAEFLLHLLAMAEYHATTPQRNGTERLIVTTDESGAGHLKMHRIADRVMNVHDTLVWGPTPSAVGPSAFFRAREAAYDDDPHIKGELFEWDRAAPALDEWQELVAVCATYERVELWLDPSPNEQLLGLQLLVWLGGDPAILERLHVVHADGRLGERAAPHDKTLNAEILEVGSRELETAAAAWNAYCQPTPAAWFALLARDIDALPFLRRTIRLLLGELPAADTGLGATERLILDVLAPGGVRPMRFFHVNTRENPDRVYGFFEEIKLLNGLGDCPRPVVLGLVEGFDVADLMRPDPDRRQNYLASVLTLSDLGHALRAGKDDFARHNPIHRWWGGTLLTNDHLWRWDAASETLVAPR